MQNWPAIESPLCTQASAAASTSASSNTKAGLLPPSSSRTRVKSCDAERMIARPVAVEPVKATARTRGCSTSAEPTSAPPWTTPRTPSGTPASVASATRRSVVSGVCRGRLDHRGHAGRQRRSEVAEQQNRGGVPRNDERGDANRHALDERDRAVGQGAGVPLEQAGDPGVEADRVGSHRQFAVGLPPQLPGLAHDQLGQFVRVRGDRAAPVVERARACDGVAAPFGERRLGAVHDRIQVGGRGDGDGAELGAGSGVVGDECGHRATSRAGMRTRPVATATRRSGSFGGAAPRHTMCRSGRTRIAA